MKKFLKFSVLFLALALAMTSCDKDKDNLEENSIVRNIDGETAMGAAVMVMDTSMVSAKLQEISVNGTLKFNNLTAEDMPVKGDIICSAPSKAAPQGFLYKVRGITTKGAETTIVTEMTTIEEAVKEASVNQSVDLTITDIENVRGVETEQLRQASNSQLRAANDLTLTALKLKVDIPLEDGSKHIKGDIELKTTFHCEMNFEGWALKHLLLTTKPQFKAKLAATIESKIEKEIPFHITTLKFAPVTVWAGIVPVVFTPKLDIDATLTLKGEIKLQATLVDWDYSFTFGCRYDNGAFTSISENTSKPAKYLEDLQLILSGEMKLQPKLSYYYDLYNTGSNAGVFGEFYAKLKVEDKIGSDKKISFSCGLEFGADAELKIFSNEIGKWKLTFCSLDWLIWEKPWGITEDIDNIIPDNIWEDMEELGLEIHGGNNPPLIEGTYFVSPFTFISSNFSCNYKPGDLYTRPNLLATFSEQNNTNQTIKVNYNFGQGWSIANGTGTYITGEDNKFTVFSEVIFESGGGRNKCVTVASGEIENNGIKNFQYYETSIYVYSGWWDLMTGQSWLFKDGNGFSEKRD
jgi:hypothetical protein